jgi:hypothetical protein
VIRLLCLFLYYGSLVLTLETGDVICEPGEKNKRFKVHKRRGLLPPAAKIKFRCLALALIIIFYWVSAQGDPRRPTPRQPPGRNGQFRVVCCGEAEHLHLHIYSCLKYFLFYHLWEFKLQVRAFRTFHHCDQDNSTQHGYHW